jgi:streptogramin lyase
VFIGNGLDGTIQRVDPKTGKAQAPLRVSDDPGTLISEFELGGGSAWIRLDDEKLARVDLESGQVVATIQLKHSPNGIAWSEAGVWVSGNGNATRVDPANNKADEAIKTPSLAEDIAIEADTVWLPNSEDGTVERLTADFGQVNTQPLKVGTQPDPIEASDGIVWVADEDEEALRKVDAERGQVAGEPIPLGDFPFDIEVGPDGLFVLCNDSVVQVDRETGKVSARFPLEGDVDDIAVGLGFLWMADGNANTLTRVPLG